MKSKNNQNLYDPLFDLDKRIRESDDIIAQYWRENPDLLEAVTERKETAKIIAKLWQNYPEQPAPLLFPKVTTPHKSIG